jgi:hypothetical protein
MTTTPRLALVLSLGFALALGATATGCSSDPSTMSGGGGGDDDDDGGGGDDDGGPPKPLDASGTFAMRSTFDLATNMPGTAGTVINTIIAATDDTDDPTRWIVDQVLGQLADGTIKSALELGRDLAVGALNKKLLDLAPDFVTTVVQVGDDFGELARHVGLNETLTLTRSDAGYTAVHSVVGLHYKLGNQQGDFLFANYHVSNVVVSNVSVTMDATGHLTIAAHDVPLAYGELLRLALDAAIIPLIDPSARSLNELVAHKVDCKAVGKTVADAIKFSSAAGTIEAACVGGLASAANYVYSKIGDIDGTALRFSLNGSARAVDKTADRKIDVIQTGTWAGTLAYGSTPAPLAPATFSGERM